MSVAGQLLFNDTRAGLVSKLSPLTGRGELDEAFVAWLLPSLDIGLTTQGPAQVAAGRIGAQRTYQDVAVLGFAAAANSITPDQRNILREGLKWLSGREPFVNGSPTGVCFDAVALLGIALGTTHLKDDTIKRTIAKWMEGFIVKCFKMPLVLDWQRCLFAAAQREVEKQPTLAPPDNSSVADVRVALCAKGILPTPEKVVCEKDETDVLLLLKQEGYDSIETTRAALRVAAFDWINRSVPVLTPNRVTAEEVSQLLRRVPAGLRRWTWEDVARTSAKAAKPRKWFIDNEYHVQSILWLLLAPIFPDLKDEEYTPAVGPLHPRADICIPSLNLIVEVKFMRANKSLQELIEEVAADSNLYLTKDSGYRNIIAFVWDDSCRTEQHDILIQGLKKIQGIIDAVVVSRPGAMLGKTKPTSKRASPKQKQ